MNEEPIPHPPDASTAAPAAGAQLRAAREAEGLSIETVAHHLKLAPRQVRALEDGDYAGLPGRTFVRGFARNYARLMQLDPDAIVAALPDAVAAPALDRPVLGSSTPSMGELPVSQQPGGVAWSRWMIPLALVALIAVAAAYELTRNDGRRAADSTGAATRAATIDPIGPLPDGGTPLPNPLPGGGTAEPAGNAPTPGEPAAGSATPASLPISTAAPADRAPAVAEATLVIAYRAPAWTDVRDANGRRILLVTGAPGTTQTVSGTPPFDLTLGNASQTSVTWRGAAFDLGPHVNGNVARARLP